MDEALLDTDVLSEVLKRKDQQVLITARQYLAEHQRFTFSAITVYEIVRGMRATGATRQLAGFLKTVETSEVLPANLPVLMRAADLWSDARNSGHPRDDADLIIAATALEAGRVLVTGNTQHFSWIPGLRLADWRSVTP
ncbi:MAG TPA: type II toxin-antitoxin system VapC family toxin [Pirellulales bacterium]|jgi:tRNA(fMet)-specific endonuclease VapC|nr:type II toxin-antitoxin system VapC family toxin [Pirellulales bacterium]